MSIVGLGLVHQLNVLVVLLLDSLNLLFEVFGVLIELSTKLAALLNLGFEFLNLLSIVALLLQRDLQVLGGDGRVVLQLVDLGLVRPQQLLGLLVEVELLLEAQGSLAQFIDLHPASLHLGHIFVGEARPAVDGLEPGDAGFGGRLVHRCLYKELPFWF